MGLLGPLRTPRAGWVDWNHDHLRGCISAFLSKAGCGQVPEFSFLSLQGAFWCVGPYPRKLEAPWGAIRRCGTCQLESTGPHFVWSLASVHKGRACKRWRRVREQQIWARPESPQGFSQTWGITVPFPGLSYWTTIWNKMWASIGGYLGGQGEPRWRQP